MCRAGHRRAGSCLEQAIRLFFPSVIAALVALPAAATPLSYFDRWQKRGSVTFFYPTVGLENGLFYPVHSGDGIDYCRQSGFRHAGESEGEHIRGGLARHKGGRWQYTFDGPLIYRLECY